MSATHMPKLVLQSECHDPVNLPPDVHFTRRAPSEHRGTNNKQQMVPLSAGGQMPTGQIADQFDRNELGHCLAAALRSLDMHQLSTNQLLALTVHLEGLVAEQTRSEVTGRVLRLV
jgi:hypothetical protein